MDIEDTGERGAAWVGGGGGARGQRANNTQIGNSYMSRVCTTSRYKTSSSLKCFVYVYDTTVATKQQMMKLLIAFCPLQLLSMFALSMWCSVYGNDRKLTKFDRYTSKGKEETQ